MIRRSITSSWLWIRQSRNTRAPAWQLRLGDGLAPCQELCRGQRLFATLPPHMKLQMPALSPTMERGNIATWFVKEGDELTPGMVLADVETDKATMAFENQDEGFLAKILCPDGSKDIAVGAPVAIIVEEADDVAAFATYSEGATASASPSAPPSAATSAPAPAPAPAPAASASYPPHTGLAMPSLSPTMDRGNIVSWAVKEGDSVVAGDVLAEIETDKAVLAFETQEDGVIAKILSPSGTKDIPVGQLVAILVEDAALASQFKDYSISTSAAAAPPDSTSAPAPAPAPSPSTSRSPGAHANSRIGPAAKYYLALHGLAQGDIHPTGPRDIITKADVLAAVAAGVRPAAQQQPQQQPPPAQKAPVATKAAAPPAAAKPPQGAAGGSYTDLPTTQIRRIIAQRLLESKRNIPCMYVSADADLGAVSTLRKSLAEQGFKLSVNDFVIKAVALALRDVPEANVFWDVATQQIAAQPAIDICVAVATDKGLLTPILTGAAARSLLDISTSVKVLAGRAREGKLKPEEFTGGSFTISNLGMFGISEFSAIINPPQAAILAVGGSQQRVVLGEGAGSPAGPRSESFMTVTLSADARVYDEELAGKLLGAFQKYMANPVAMVM